MMNISDYIIINYGTSQLDGGYNPMIVRIPLG